VAQLLVSVRSASEARAAIAGGAAIIDVKEPRNGPLGRATGDVWSQVLAVVADRVPVSVALGELNEWFVPQPPEPVSWPGELIAYAKLGLSDAGSDWREQWRNLRSRLAEMQSPAPEWVAVLYADWKRARALHPDLVLGEALEIDECRGVLIDTFDKSRPSPIDARWKDTTDCIRNRGRFLALAGRMDVDAIEQVASLEPDIIAVRGAACTRGDRLGVVEVERVARLAQAASKITTRPPLRIAHPVPAANRGRS